MHLETVEVETPIGAWAVVTAAHGLVLLHLDGDWDSASAVLFRRFGPVTLKEADDPLEARSRIAAYLAGDLRAIDALPVDPGGTPVQQQVWAELRRIPAGRTSTYAGLAAAIGRPTATRAVGAATGRNPIAIVLPCHRVVGTNGGLTGYGGGLERKAWLLRHEGSWI